MNRQKSAWLFPNIVGFSALVCVVWFMTGCSSHPDAPPEPSKKEIRQDADRFFHKMGAEEDQK